MIYIEGFPSYSPTSNNFQIHTLCTFPRWHFATQRHELLFCHSRQDTDNLSQTLMPCSLSSLCNPFLETLYFLLELNPLLLSNQARLSALSSMLHIPLYPRCFCKSQQHTQSRNSPNLNKNGHRQHSLLHIHTLHYSHTASDPHWTLSLLHKSDTPWGRQFFCMCRLHRLYKAMYLCPPQCTQHYINTCPVEYLCCMSCQDAVQRVAAGKETSLYVLTAHDEQMYVFCDAISS